MTFQGFEKVFRWIWYLSAQYSDPMVDYLKLVGTIASNHYSFTLGSFINNVMQIKAFSDIPSPLCHTKMTGLLRPLNNVSQMNYAQAPSPTCLMSFINDLLSMTQFMNDPLPSLWHATISMFVK